MHDESTEDFWEDFDPLSNTANLSGLSPLVSFSNLWLEESNFAHLDDGESAGSF